MPGSGKGEEDRKEGRRRKVSLSDLTPQQTRAPLRRGEKWGGRTQRSHLSLTEAAAAPHDGRRIQSRPGCPGSDRAPTPPSALQAAVCRSRKSRLGQLGLRGEKGWCGEERRTVDWEGRRVRLPGPLALAWASCWDCWRRPVGGKEAPLGRAAC